MINIINGLNEKDVMEYLKYKFLYYKIYYTMHFQIAILLDWFEDLPDGI